MTWRDASIDWRDPAGGIPIWLTLLIGIVAALICTAIAAAIGVAATPGIDWINPAGMGGDNSVVITAVLSASDRCSGCGDHCRIPTRPLKQTLRKHLVY